MKNVFALVIVFLGLGIFISLSAQTIQSGPMLGYSEMFETLIWVQTKSAAKIKAKYWVKTKPTEFFFTEELTTKKSEAFTAKLIADKTQPDNTYEYEIIVNGKPEKFTYPLSFRSKQQWLWRKPAPDFVFALGSCVYVSDPPYDRPGTPYGSGYHIFNSIYNKKPDMMLWLGDNTYLREPDWDTKTGIFYRYTHTRSLKEMQPLLASTNHFAIWDDHDFGPNDSDRSFWNKNTTFDAFKLFWGNPSFGVGDTKGAITTFQWSDCDFFLLDNRFYRSPNERKTGTCTVLGEQQKQWLIDALVSSKATFKFVVMGGQFLNPFQGFEIYNKICPEERDEILSVLLKEKIPGIVFLTGDRHYTEISKLDRAGSYPLYDITVSSLTSGSHTGAEKEPNNLRIPGTLIMEKNFGTIEISGAKDERQLKFSVFNSDGEEKYSKIILAKEVK